MNLMMHGISEPQIDYSDTLSTRFNEDGAYDCVLANPPFTGSIDKSDINTSFELKTTKSELLFLERIYKMLKIGGTAGVVVPQGVLFGSSKVNIQIRQMIIDRCELKAVISMPSGVFKPYTGVTTAILVFTKGGATENIWFYDMASDGWSLDDKRAELFTKDGVRDFGDLHKVITEFKTEQKSSNRKERHFFVPKHEIIKNNYELSFNKYHERVFDEVIYESPKKIIEKLASIEKQINIGINELEAMFNEVN
jgi:type I restriction enzyme M protein